MTIASAASLPGHGQEAPFSPLPVRSRIHRATVPPRAAALPRRQQPRTVWAEDPPLGRILVVTNEAPLALDIQRILRNAGYRAVGPAASVEEADRLASRGPIDGAIVDMQLGAQVASLVADCLTRHDIPFVWVADPLLGRIPRPHAFVAAVPKPVSGDTLLPALERALASKRDVPSGGFYRVPPPQEAWPRVFPQL